MNSNKAHEKRSVETSGQAPISLVADEYKALRDEILRRLDYRYQIINFALVTVTAILAVGLQQIGSQTVLLIYPLLGTFFANAWADNILAIVCLAAYIKDKYEDQRKGYGIGWETYLAEEHPIPGYAPGKLGHFYSVGIFVATEAITLGLGITRNTGKPEELILIGLGLIAFVYTAYLMFYRLNVRRDTKSQSTTKS